MKTKIALAGLILTALAFAFGVSMGVAKLAKSHKPSTTKAYISYVNSHQAQFEVEQIYKCRTDILPGYTVCVAAAKTAKGVACIALVAKTGTTKAYPFAQESTDTCLFAS